MQIPGISTWAAPQTTGHPLGLPGTVIPAVKDTRITASRATSDSAMGKDQNPPYTAPNPPRAMSGTSGDEPAAPPTIMQLKINSLLQEQAQERLEEVAETRQPAAQTTEVDAQADVPAQPATDAPQGTDAAEAGTDAQTSGYAAGLDTQTAEPRLSSFV